MRGLLLALGLSAGLITCAIVFRPVLPIDETRYLSVAWEMKWRGDYVVSHMSGHTYSHKPPLLFWLINVVWAVFGELEIFARLVAPTAGLVCLYLVRLVARGFWPDDSKSQWLAPVLMSATFFWCIFLPMTMFDTLVTLSLLISTIGLQRACAGQSFRGWSIVGLGIGLGLLAKGPVIFLFVIPGSLAFAWLQREKVSADQQKKFVARWSLGTLVAILMGAAIVLSWAIPSALIGGSEYAHDLFFGQTAGRMVKSFAHKRPVYWYVPFLPLAALPWIAFRPTWSFWRVTKSDRIVKMLLAWIACTFTLFSLVSGKQLHYILPLVPLWTLVVARTISSQAESRQVSKLDVLPVAVCSFATMIVPILLDHVPGLTQQGLSGLVDSWISVAFGLLGLAVVAAPIRSMLQQIGLIACTAVMWSCFFLAGTTNYWQGCGLTGLAREVAKHDAPIIWFGDNQAQLNFLGRIRHIEQAADPAELAEKLASAAEAWIIYPAVKARRSDQSPEPGPREITPADQARAEEIADQLLKDSQQHKSELSFLFTRNRELYTEDYYLLRVTTR